MKKNETGVYILPISIWKDKVETKEFKKLFYTLWYYVKIMCGHNLCTRMADPKISEDNWSPCSRQSLQGKTDVATKAPATHSRLLFSDFFLWPWNMFF